MRGSGRRNRTFFERFKVFLTATADRNSCRRGESDPSRSAYETRGPSMGRRRKREPALHLARAAAYEAGLELCLSFPQRPRVESSHVLSVRSREAASRGEGIRASGRNRTLFPRFVAAVPVHGRRHQCSHWRRMRESNSRYRLERAMSWATRRMRRVDGVPGRCRAFVSALRRRSAEPSAGTFETSRRVELTLRDFADRVLHRKSSS